MADTSGVNKRFRNAQRPIHVCLAAVGDALFAFTFAFSRNWLHFSAAKEQIHPVPTASHPFDNIIVLAIWIAGNKSTAAVSSLAFTSGHFPNGYAKDGLIEIAAHTFLEESSIICINNLFYNNCQFFDSQTSA